MVNEVNYIACACGWCHSMVHEAHMICLASFHIISGPIPASYHFSRSPAAAEMFSASHFQDE
jgi:hypothetical protein